MKSFKSHSTINLIAKSLFVITFAILLSSCSSFDIGKNSNEGKVVHLNESVLPNTSLNNGISNYGKYELDLDNDKNIDITFLVENHSLGRESYSISKIVLHNNFTITSEKAIKYYQSESYNSNLDSLNKNEIVDLPKIFSLSDTITGKLTMLNDTLTFAYSYQNSFTTYTWNYSQNSWVGIGDKYIGIHNKELDVLGWIKLNLPKADEIYLRSYQYKINADFLIINEGK